MSEHLPIFVGVLAGRARSLLFWGLALAAVSAMYLSFYPSLGGDVMSDLVADLPEDMVTALNYDMIGTAGGWVTGTVYGVVGPALLLVFAIGTGARLLAGEEEAGTIELELASPVSRLRVLGERLAALVSAVLLLIAVVTIVSWILIVALDMDVPFGRLLAGSAGLFLLTLAFGSLAFAIGAATGRRAWALSGGGALAVAAFMFDALGPVVELDWMSEVSPFFWYLGGNPILDGFDWAGLAKLAAVVVIAGGVAAWTFPRRDLKI